MKELMAELLFYFSFDDLNTEWSMLEMVSQVNCHMRSKQPSN